MKIYIYTIFRIYIYIYTSLQEIYPQHVVLNAGLALSRLHRLGFLGTPSTRLGASPASPPGAFNIWEWVKSPTVAQFTSNLLVFVDVHSP